MSTVIKEQFQSFCVYTNNDQKTFIHIEIEDTQDFYEKLFEHFFDEQRFLRYIENKTTLIFNPSTENYVALFKGLNQYIDDEVFELTTTTLDGELVKILEDEYTLDDKDKKDGSLHIRLDKMGKIGEFLCCNILSEYFGYNCILPKVNLTTDKNMSVFGIDAIFYSPENKMTLFAEAKISKSLDNAISLINKSLSTYIQQIESEFLLVLSNRWYRDKMGKFSEDFSEFIDKSTSMKKFIEKAKIDVIGIPVFMAHGEIISEKEIFNKFKKVKSIKLFDIETKIISISLPVVNKSKMISVFTKKIKERCEFYESRA